MTNRVRLPNRRAHEVFGFRHGDFEYVAGVGRFADGRLAEIFLALQHGVAAETLRHALSRNTDGSAASPLGAALDILAHGA